MTAFKISLYILGAIFIESDSIDSANEVFTRILWRSDPQLAQLWHKPPLHPLQVC